MRSPDGSINVIPLTPVENAPTARAEVMRAAVLEALEDLLIERVPESKRSPYFKQARDLLVQAGWSPEELLEAAAGGPRRDELWRVLKLDGD
jgi:hypothetical protein